MLNQQSDPVLVEGALQMLIDISEVSQYKGSEQIVRYDAT